MKVSGQMDLVELEFGLHRREAETYWFDSWSVGRIATLETRVISKFPVDKIDIETLC